MAWVTQAEVAQAVDLVINYAKSFTASTANKWDDAVVGMIAGQRDNLVNLVCALFGVKANQSPLVHLTAKAGPIGDTVEGFPGLDLAGLSDGIKQVVLFLLNLLMSWFHLPLPTPVNG